MSNASQKDIFILGSYVCLRSSDYTQRIFFEMNIQKHQVLNFQPPTIVAT